DGEDLGPLQICAGDDDWYATTVVTGTITVDLSFTHDEGDLDLELVSSTSMSVVASSTSMTDDEQIVYAVPAPGEALLVRVFGADGTVENAYTLGWMEE